MTNIYHASGVQEAVEMAEKFKDDGVYDWFRGQTRDWPPISSMARCNTDPARQKNAHERYAMFFEWLRRVPEMRSYANFDDERNVHSVFAMLQHYGVPTHYIDFTTDAGVAGFFASDSVAQELGTTACIYCLNTQDLMGVWDLMRNLDERARTKLELVSIDVTNLWRLQAQKGVFLFCNYNWDIDYPMDRILFPTNGYPAYPTRDLIYPAQKSSLELVLDRYFDVEAKRIGSRELRRMFADLSAKGANVAWHDVESPDGFFAHEAFLGGRLEPLESWNRERLANWFRLEDATLSEVSGSPVSLRLDPSVAASTFGKSVRYGVGRLLRSNPNARKKTVNWQIQGLKDPSQNEALGKALETIWNGMRWLPFSTEDIVDACGVASSLFVLDLGKKERKERKQIVDDLLGESFEVEFGATDGSSSRGYVTCKSLIDALRPDIEDLLLDEYKSRSRDARGLLRLAYSPSRLFDFEKFSQLFAREVIPTQILTRDFKLFSAADLQTFGLP
jgi:hypothetical protein